ncbi:MAG: ABC transporter permease, partial [Acidobacteriota bacterium]
MLLQDVRYALRNLWHSKGFAVVAILCLGFGIGLNATIFSVIDGVLLKPYPYTDPDRILVVGERKQRNDSQSGLSFLDMRDWKEANSVFTTIAAVAARSLTISDVGAEPERYLGAGISWDLFPLLGTSPILGRGFTAEDDRPNAGNVVLLGYELWARRYHSDQGIIGRPILINAKPYVVVGIMPPKFAFPNNQRLWIPLEPMAANDPRGVRGLFAFGRLKPGVTIERARQVLDAIAARLAVQYPLTGHAVFAREDGAQVLMTGD